MIDIVLYCKSYRKDLLRLGRLAKSISRFNSDKLPFYVSVPKEDRSLFVDLSVAYNFTLINDEEIINLNEKIDQEKFASLPGSLQQQIVKSEFWRLNISECYLCIDSDSEFTRAFSSSDFISPEFHPYTTIHQEHQLIDDLLFSKKYKILDNYFDQLCLVKNKLKREGPVYSFGPTPAVWSRRVWESLEKNYLDENKINIMDAILDVPFELRWYGEALLKYKAVGLIPIEPLFKVLHYHWQNKLRQSFNSTYFDKLYMGIVFQSNWDAQMDWPKERGTLLSRAARRIRQF